MKFTTFLKVFAISLACFIGAIGIGVGVMAIAGYFNQPSIMPENIAFDRDVYNVDSDFSITITTTTEDVTVTQLTLSLQNGELYTEKNGEVRISDGVISIPQTATIGEPFNVTLNKTLHDDECGGLDWITGGHSVITATSQNQKINPINATVNVDVPVYSVTLETRVSAQEEDSDVFAVGSTVNASLKFYPERSAYKYSHDGSDGEVEYKTTYFMPQSTTDENITQNEHTNSFLTNRIGSSTIVGYVFSSTPIEERILLGLQNLDDEAKYSAVLTRLEQLSTQSSETSLQAHKAVKAFNIVEVEVDSMRLEGTVNNVDIDTTHTLYANKNVTQSARQSNLGIKLYSSLDESISLQNELKNVGIRFLYKVGNGYYDAVNNQNSAYNIVSMIDDGYGETRQVEIDGQVYTYYFPKITQSVDDYLWEFAVSKYVDANAIRIEIRYFGKNFEQIEPLTVDFSTNAVTDAGIYWSKTSETLTIIDGENPIFKSFDVKPLAVVPQQNLYKTPKYFVLESSQYSVSDLIYTKGEAVDYQLGAQTVTLYEIEEGIIQPKSTEAYGRTFEILFMTIQTDYKGNPKLDEQERYIVQKYSQDNLNAISTLDLYVDKTLYGLENHIQTALSDDNLTLNDETNDIAYVQNTTAPFEVVVKLALPQSATQSEQINEQQIFADAVNNNEIYVVAKIEESNSETSLIYTDSVTQQNDGTQFAFSMNIGELSDGVSERRIKLYVVYDNDAFNAPREYEVNLYNDAQTFDCIEVYDGSATVFDFNLNIQEDGIYESSVDNRILVSTNIASQNDYINSITTSYTLGGNDVSSMLFETDDLGEIDYSTLSVVLADKYGKLPISSQYTLESSNTSILTVSNGTFTFNGTGNVEVYLRDAKGAVKDTLYFTCVQEGYVSKVEQLQETPSAPYSKSMVSQEYSAEKLYDFAQQSIKVVGYAGSIVNFKSTTVGDANLLTYYYTSPSGSGYLTSLLNISLVNDQDATVLEDYVGFEGTTSNLSGLTILKDFGKPYSLQLRITVAPLGISQIVVLEIQSNITLALNSSGNDYQVEPISSVGNVPYLGAYADSLYKVSIQVHYLAGTGSEDFTLDQSAYSLFLYEYDENGDLSDKILLGNNANANANAYVASFKLSGDNEEIQNNAGVQRLDGSKDIYNYDVYIVFKSLTENNGYRRVMLAFEKNVSDAQINASVDASSQIYLYINPNVMTTQSSDEILLDVAYDTINGGSTRYYGSATLLGTVNAPLTINRIYNSNIEIDGIAFDIDYSQIGFRFVDENDSNNFAIQQKPATNEFVIYSLSNINNSKNVKLIVTYNGIDVLTSDGKTYEITLNVRPNITRNTDSTMWVLYGGEYYIKFVNGEQYTFDDILQAFTITHDQNSTAQITAQLNIESTNNIVVQGNIVTIQGVNDNIIAENSAVLALSSGDSIIFNIILLPFDLPYVIYPNQIQDQEYDLLDLLDIDWVMENGLYYTISEYNADGYNIFIDGQTQNYGLSSYLKGSILSVKNIDEQDLHSYARFDGDKLIVEPVGKETYVIIEAKLNRAVNSLIVPYLVKIEQMLDVNIYYPYVLGNSENQNISGSELYGNVQDVKYDMEYLSFDDKGSAKLNLLERFDNLTPNSQNGQRIVVGILVNGQFTPQVEPVPSSKLTFSISEVAYYFYGWFTAKNVSLYAQVTSDGVVTINRSGAQYVRVKVGMTTESGLTAYYYISAGEIPEFSFTQRTEMGVSSPDIEDINLKAGDEGLSLDGLYSLSMYLNQSGSLTSANELLCYYIVPTGVDGQSAHIDYDTMKLYADDTTENWNTNMVFYTKYGTLNVVTLFVLSNYSIKLIDDSVLTEASSGAYEIEVGNVLNIADTFQIVKDDTGETFSDFDNITAEIVTPNSAIQYVQETNSLKIGVVTEDTAVKIKIKFIFTDDTQSVTYNFDFSLTIKATLKVGTLNYQQISQNNMLPVENIQAGKTQDVDNILLSLFDYTGVDFDKWYQNVVDNNLGKLSVELITQNAYGDFKGSVVLDENNHYVVQLDISEVADETNLSFRVSYYNTVSGDDILVMNSYFNFTVTPNFKIVTNYPSPNDDLIAVAESYWFDSSANAQNVISLTEMADLAQGVRVEVQSENTEEAQSDDINYASHIYVRVGNGAEYVYANGEAVGNQYLNLNTEFSIQSSEHVSVYDGLNIQFGLYYALDGQTTFIPIGVYNVVVFNSVYQFTGYNYNTSVMTNSSNNPENIYIGSNDDILSKIKVTLAVPMGVDLSTTKYVKISAINGLSANSDYVALAQGSQGTNISFYVTLSGLTVSDMTGFVSSDMGVTWEIYELSDNGEYERVQTLDDVWNNLEISFDSRISLSYRTVTALSPSGDVPTTSFTTIDFFKTYGLLSGTDCTLVQSSETITQEQVISKSIYVNTRNGHAIADQTAGTAIGTYYVNYGFDIVFDKTSDIELSAGQNTSVLHNGAGYGNANYISLLNMKRGSDNTYYLPSDFSSTGLSLNITEKMSNSATNSEYQNLIKDGVGYLRYTAAESDAINYDYNFMAYGSPKETTVTVTLVLTVAYGAITKDYTFSFIVSHDYVNESLINSDRTINTSLNRNLIRDYNFIDYIVFAKWGSKSIIENSSIANYIYIEHKNENQNEPGNVAPMFNVTYDQGGEYVVKYEQSSQNYDLAFKFSDIKFGNKNVDITLTDPYGYKMTYYVTIVAQYNISYTTNTLTAFELDTVALIDKDTSVNEYNHTIPVTFVNRDSGDKMTLARFSANWTASFEYAGNNAITFDVLSTGANQSQVFYFQIGLLDYSVFADSDGRIYGDLTLSAKDDEGNEIEIKIPTVIRERYSLSTSDTPYVRDGVEFSLLDIIDVVDNSKNYTVGERSLKDSYTIYFDYTIFDNDGHEVKFTDVQNVLSLEVTATNLQNNQKISLTIPRSDNSEVYFSIDNFGITDISNYRFQITYSVTTYVYDEKGVNTSTSIVAGNQFTYSDGDRSVYYYLSNETSSAYKGESEASEFNYTYHDNAQETENKTYKIKINTSYIIADQTLSIGLREIENDSKLTVYFVNEAGEVQNVSLTANKNEVATYSLRELGVIQGSQKVSLYTNSSRTIIDGLSVSQWAQLKGISFAESTDSEDSDESTLIYNMVKYINDGSTFLTSTDGLNIKYAESSIQINVSYGFSNGVATKNVKNYTADIRITLKYVDVDSTLAYGSEQARNVVLDSYISGDDTVVELDTWAGTTIRPFELVAGYTSATSFVDSDNTTLSGNGGDFVYSINTAESSGSQYAKIDENGKITLYPGFNIESNYLMIDIAVKYGEKKDVSEYIDTVRLYFTDASATTYTITANVPRLPKVASKTENYFDVKTKDILQMLSISDEHSRVYTGKEITTRFPDIVVSLYETQQGENLGKIVDWDGVNSISIPNKYANSSIYMVVQLKGSDDVGVRLNNISFVDTRYGANSLVSSSIYECVSTEGADEIFKKLLPKIQLRNIYGNIDSGLDIFNLDSIEDSEKLINSDKVICLTTTNGILTTLTYTLGNNLSQTDNTALTKYGTITVYVYKNAEQINGEANLAMEPGESTINFVNSNVIDFSDIKVYGYNTITTLVDPEGEETQTNDFIFISKDDIGTQYPFTSGVSATIISTYVNGTQIDNMFNVTISTEGILLVSSGSLSGYDKKLISLTIEYGIDSNRKAFNCSFLYRNQEKGSAIDATTGEVVTYLSTRIDENYKNVFTLLSGMYGVNVDDIYVRVKSSDVTLKNNNGSYSLVLNSTNLSSNSISVDVEFYITVYDNLSGEEKQGAQDIVLYTNTLNITVQ